MTTAIAPRTSPTPIARPQTSDAPATPTRSAHSAVAVWGGQDQFETTQVRDAEAPRAEQAGIQRDPSLRPITDAILRRLDQSNVRLDGHTPRSMFEANILNNPKITDAQIRAMAGVTVDQVADSPEAIERTERKFPNVRNTDVHNFTVDLMAGITGMDRNELSQRTPTLGVTGSASGWPFYISDDAGVQASTALHDFTDYMKGAGVEGVNRGVWGYESSFWSAIDSYIGGVPNR